MTFSIITPSFGQPEWLRLCVMSVADQAVEVEHIVQDANSTDYGLNWLQTLSSSVRLFVETDAGIYDAVNRGLRRSQGNILGYLNCDEQLLPNALSKIRIFFENNPNTEIVFAHAIVVCQQGGYLFHRKAICPQVAHTWTCPLATLSCAMFFRRSLIQQRKIFFDSQWRFCGDAEWILRLLRNKVRMAVLNEFTAAYTMTGNNLSLTPEAAEESNKFFATAPPLLRKLKPMIVLCHRLRRFLHGNYFQKPFQFSIYTQQSPQTRVTRSVTRPSFRWKH